MYQYLEEKCIVMFIFSDPFCSLTEFLHLEAQLSATQYEDSGMLPCRNLLFQCKKANKNLCTLVLQDLHWLQAIKCPIQSAATAAYAATAITTLVIDTCSI